MNEQINQELHGEDRSDGGSRWGGIGNQKKDSTTGRFMPMEASFDKKSYNSRYYLKNKQKICADSANRYAKNPEPYKRRSALRNKTCKEQIVAYRKKYRRDNSAILKAKDSAYQKLNRKRLSTRSRSYAAAHPEQRCETQHKYNVSNKGRTAMRNWARTIGKLPEHRAKRIASDARRRALETTSALPDANIAIEKISTSRHRCYYCGIKIERKKLHIDHLNPLARGGAHAAYNLVPACQTCNLTKGKKEPNRFVVGQQLLVF